MVFTTAQVTGWIGLFMWPLLRVSGMMLTAPLFNSPLAAVRVRLVITVALTVAVMPAVGAVPSVDPLSATGLMIAIQQLLIGAVMGTMIGMAFGAITISGQTIALTMGLGFATMVDPQNGQPMPVISQFFLIVATLLFVAIGGHLMLIQLLAESFHSLPVAPQGVGGNDFIRVVGWASAMFAGAVLIALPAVVILLTVNLALGVMTRAAPQMNIFSVGFPITILAGFVILLTVVVPSLQYRMTDLWRQAFDTIRLLLVPGG